MQGEEHVKETCVGDLVVCGQKVDGEKSRLWRTVFNMRLLPSCRVISGSVKQGQAATCLVSFRAINAVVSTRKREKVCRNAILVCMSSDPTTTSWTCRICDIEWQEQVYPCISHVLALYELLQLGDGENPPAHYPTTLSESLWSKSRPQSLCAC